MAYPIFRIVDDLIKDRRERYDRTGCENAPLYVVVELSPANFCVTSVSSGGTTVCRSGGLPVPEFLSEIRDHMLHVPQIYHHRHACVEHVLKRNMSLEYQCATTVRLHFCNMFQGGNGPWGSIDAKWLDNQPISDVLLTLGLPHRLVQQHFTCC